MMVDEIAQGAALHWLPTPEAATRELNPPVDGLPALLDWLAEQGFDGAVSVQSGGYELVLLVMEGALIGASLRSPVGGRVLMGGSALLGLIERIGPSARTQARVLPFPRPLVECLSSALDPHPQVRPLEGTEQLREALRDVAATGHHGVVDLVVGERWGRTLFHNGRLLGAYHYDAPTVAPSLAALGKLATAGPGTLVVRKVPARAPERLRWPVVAGGGGAPVATSAPTAPAAPPTAPVDAVRDERIETNLLWLLSHVDKDRDRASQASGPEPRVLQVLGSFANAMFTFAGHLAPSSRRRLEPPRYADVIATLRPRYPLLAELELRKDEIDAPALARRYKSLPRDGTYAGDFYRGMVRGLLALTLQAAGLVLLEIGDRAARERCAGALETWAESVETALQPGGAAAEG